METKSLLKKGEGMEVLLNYGKDEMDSATIPIQWFFSEETARKKPTHLLIVEQDKEESKEYNNVSLGSRYFCRVEEGIKFIRLFRPGYHRILVLAFSFFTVKIGREDQRIFFYAAVTDYLTIRLALQK